MKVQIYIGLNSEIHFNTQFKTCLPTVPNPICKQNKLVLLPVDWDENGLLFTKRLHMMNKIIGHS